eukprot:2555305-Rhodomonas_salina.1
MGGIRPRPCCGPQSETSVEHAGTRGNCQHDVSTSPRLSKGNDECKEQVKQPGCRRLVGVDAVPRPGWDRDSEVRVAAIPTRSAHRQLPARNLMRLAGSGSTISPGHSLSARALNGEELVLAS